MKAVLFDLDGTICDSVPLCLATFKKTLKTLVGREFTDKEITDTFGVSEEGTIRMFCPEKAEEGARLYFENYRNMHDMCPAPFDGIIDLLDELKAKGVFIGLVTGKGKIGTDITLEYFGIGHYFEVLKTGMPTGIFKQQHMQEIMSDYNFDADEVVYIGDTKGDITASRKANIGIISVAYSEGVDEKELIKASPDKMCYSVNELRSYLETVVSGCRQRA